MDGVVCQRLVDLVVIFFTKHINKYYLFKILHIAL